MTARLRHLLLLAFALGLALALPHADAAQRPHRATATAPTEARDTSAYVPPIHHVFVINIENKGYDTTWGPTSPAPYLAKKLRAKGVLLNSYYGTAHNSLGNYLAQISGQGPDPSIQADCQVYSAFVPTGTVSPGQFAGSGCVFPQSVPTLPQQLTHHDLSWKGYMDDMQTPCQHPKLGSVDSTQKATAKHNYAARHDPFVYFKSITGKPKYCKSHVVKLNKLPHDLRRVKSTPNLAYITPDLCNDGHDAPCADGRPGGLKSVNAWMKVWVPRILASPAFKRDGVLVITADESDGPTSDSTACCGEGASPNSPQPGILGPGGGVIGALVISKFVSPNTWSTTPYNHYSLLGSIEEIFGLAKLGYAASDGLDTFGLDVYNSGWNG